MCIIIIGSKECNISELSEVAREDTYRNRPKYTSLYKEHSKNYRES